MAFPYNPPLHRRIIPVILGIFWALFVLWTGWGTVSAALTLLDDTTPRFLREGSPAVLFDLNLWAFGAAVLFGGIVANPFAWLNGKRLAFGSIAFAAMLGRLIEGDLPAMLAWSTLSPPLLFIAAPLLLLVGGIAVIFAVGVLLGLLFAFFVGAVDRRSRAGRAVWV